MLDQYLKLHKCGHFVQMAHHYMHRGDPMDYLIIWVLAGRGFVKSEGQQIAARPGDLFCLCPHQSHEYGADHQQPWEILWIHFAGRLASVFVREIRCFGGLRVDLGLDAEIRDRWVELVIAHAARGPGLPIRANTGLYGLLGLIAYRLQLHTLAPTAEKPLDVYRLQTYIHQHLRGPIRLADLARQAHRSPTHFARVFKKQFAVSPIYYVIQRRIASAGALLAETASPLKQISQAVGYNDPYYFSRIFKKITGTSPTAYRRSKRSTAQANAR